MGPPNEVGAGTPHQENRPANLALSKSDTDGKNPSAGDARVLGSQQVSWLEVHEFVEAMTAHANCGPLLWPGTPLWCQLSDGDPRKLLAVAQFGVHHALRVEVAQQASCEASHEISAGADWAAISQRIRTDAEFYAAKPFLRMRP